MKKEIEFVTANLDPYSALNFSEDVLKHWGIQRDWETIRQFKSVNKGKKVVARWGNPNCGIEHIFQKVDNYWDSYKIHATYELYGLKGKNKLVVERLYETARFKEESKAHFIIRAKGEDAFCEFVAEAVKRDFPGAEMGKA